MSTNDFLTKQNVDLLWEVIIDDDLFKNKPSFIYLCVWLDSSKTELSGNIGNTSII